MACLQPQGLSRLEELVRKLTDLVTHRVEANLDAIRDTLLVDLPADRSEGQLGLDALPSVSLLSLLLSTK